MLLSIIALYNYDNTILNGMSPYLPDKPSDVDHSTDWRPINFEILVNTILLRAGELSLVYTDPDLFKLALSTWAARNRLKWQALFDTCYYRYDPLFSKIRRYTLERKTTNTNNDTKTVGDLTDQTDNRSDNRTIDTNNNERYEGNVNGSHSESVGVSSGDSYNDTKTHYVQAYDDIGVGHWAEKERDSTTGSTNGYENTNTNGSNNEDSNGTNTFTGKMVDDLTGRLSRNINRQINEYLERDGRGTLNDIITETVEGQRPFQELIQLQRELVEFNLYDYIADSFVGQFCILIY